MSFVFSRDWPAGFPPIAALHVCGSSGALAMPGIAIIGSTAPSARSIQMTRVISRQVVAAGYSVVAGLASGVDAVAHATALRNGGTTIAVLAAGLAAPIYPTANRGLADGIVAGGGALVSEYADHTLGRPIQFVERDRIQAALSRAVIVIQTDEAGGTMHTARAACTLGIPVFVLDPCGDDDAGNEALLDGRWLPAVPRAWSAVKLPSHPMPARRLVPGQTTLQQWLHQQATLFALGQS